jgi:diguanylate cyclase (GGDEF)-like protein
MADRGSSGFDYEEGSTPWVQAISGGDRGPKRPCLVVIAGTPLGEVFPVVDEMVIGRAPAVEVRVGEDRGVSRRHAALSVRDGRVVIRDLGSANGTYVDGQRVTEQVLEEGVKIRIGQTTVLRYARFDEAEERQQRRLLEEALRDGMTHAFNRRYFMQRLDAELRYAERQGQSLCMVMLDLDGFKDLNDAHGHPAGDRVLIEVTQLINDTLRSEDVLARYGGEEFAVLACNTSIDNGLILAERLRRAVARTQFFYAGKTLSVTVSVGVAALAADPAGSGPTGPTTSTSDQAGARLIEAADAALYRAKRAGRNRISR